VVTVGKGASKKAYGKVFAQRNNAPVASAIAFNVRVGLTYGFIALAAHG